MKVKILIFLASLNVSYCCSIQGDDQGGNHQLLEKAGLYKQLRTKVSKQRPSGGFQETSVSQKTLKKKVNEGTATTTESLTNGLNTKERFYSFATKKRKTFNGQALKLHVQKVKCKSDSIYDSKDVKVRSQSRLTSSLIFFKDHGGRKRRDTERSVPDIKNCTSSLVSCKDRCMKERDAGGTQHLRCSCDPYCNYFKDCCADYVQYCLGQRSSNITQTAIKVPDKPWSCRSGIWMIASCPQSWTNKDINESCSSITSMTADNYKDVIPVVAADNKTYANRFCAQCHEQNMKTIVYLAEKIEFQCLVSPPSHTTEQNKMKFLFEYCKMNSLSFKKDKSKRGCFEVEAKCNGNFTSSEETKVKCLNQHYGIVFEAYTKQMFKNVHCALCNNAVLNNMRCGPFPRREKKQKIRPSSTAIPFSVIMDIGGETSHPLTLSGYLSCPNGKVYDTYLETCRQGQKPVPFVSNLKVYDIVMWMKIKANQSVIPGILHEKFDFSKSFALALVLNFTQILNFEVEVLDSDDDLIKVEFQIDITGDPTTSKITTSILFDSASMSSMQLPIGDVHFIVIKVTSKPLTCVQTDTYSPHEYKVIPDTAASVYINKTGEVLDVRDYFSTNQTIIKGKLVSEGQIVVCRQMPSVSCSGMYIFLKKHEYTIFRNRSMLYKASGHLYERGTYTWKNGTIMICTDFTTTYEQGSQSSNDHKALTILTYIGFCISVGCLLFVLVTYSIFADLRTIPGINLMNLCCALLVAQVLWLVGSGLTFTQLGCMVIAIVLHYSFLSSFWWMSIIAFSTWRAFSGEASTRKYRNENRQKQRKRIVRTMAMGWFPLVIYVSTCVALDGSETVLIGYGGEKGCWINNHRANLFFFAIPVGLSMLWNAVFFVLIIKDIRKAIDQSQMVASQHQARQDLTVYARIAVLMGFTWVFGFVAPFTSYYLMYPFVILNTLQGLYIAVAFGFTRRVRTLYRNIGTIWNRNTSSKGHIKSIDGTHKTKISKV